MIISLVISSRKKFTHCTIKSDKNTKFGRVFFNVFSKKKKDHLSQLNFDIATALLSFSVNEPNIFLISAKPHVTNFFLGVKIAFHSS